jgi:ABC-type phosphate transport system ATPase subunit
MHLTEYEVEINIPEQMQFDGPVPFDMSIEDDVAYITVIAASPEEARMKVYEYFENKYK